MSNNQKMAYIDIDGTLSIPRYKNKNGELVPGFSDAEWKQLNIDSDNSYEFCGTPKQMYILLENLKQNGYTLNVLSAEDFNPAKQCKTRFVTERYGDFFDADNIIYVNNKHKKIEYFQKLHKKGMPFENIYFLDDDFELVLHATELGVDAHHISELFDIQPMSTTHD